jgi:kynurenine formamidase
VNPEATSSGRYDGRGADSPRWWPSRYGQDDELGSLNEICPERVRAALTLPKTGKVIEIAQTLSPDAPAAATRPFAALVLAHTALEGTMISPNGTQLCAFEEHVSQSYHVGSHVDGLGHVGISGRFYNGHHYRDFYSPTGLTRFGIETLRPWVTRGVCLDIAALEGADVLPAGFVITTEHLEAACRRQEIEVRPGDAVLLHTGWAANWTDPHAYLGGEPGAGWDASHWLTDRRASIVGADNWAFEAIPFEKPEWEFVNHQHLLTETGTYILENITTAPLVAGRHYEFLFVMASNKVYGATASVVSPVIVV